MNRFGPSEYTDYDEELAHIKQTGALREYQKEFERLASRVQDWPEKALVGAFMGGLKPELAAEVRVYKPRTYTEAIEFARLRDDHSTAIKKAVRPEGRRLGYVTPEAKNNGGVVRTANPRPIPSDVKRLAWEEMQKRREKGLCFNCDEKFVPDHRCRTRQSFFIEVTDSCDEEDSAEAVEEETTKISIHALADIQGPRTIRLGSWIKGRRVIVLIDSGSSHNFVNQDIAKKLHLDATQVEPFHVRVASGDRLICKEIYQDVPIQVQGVRITVNL